MKLVRPLALLLAAVALLAAVPGSGAASGPAPRPAARPQQPRSALPRLVFFMNPYGVPCQMQERVLREMGPELTERAELVVYRTTEQADLGRFAAYGVRALPMLIVTDASGKELRRATPGIQSMPQVIRLLSP
ncbi:MAG TPA: hypothetical protein VLS93_19055 [Anaeromyxobacteraceae bacterium]|nr:hypothetical protein [Anaeromyxobacteraceae bacterium]